MNGVTSARSTYVRSLFPVIDSQLSLKMLASTCLTPNQCRVSCCRRRLPIVRNSSSLRAV
ncbi:Protein of unknown function [Pyronema omphalodes CBS 100304]|uniref:Uncharacterized protein n=1 Tax=Pyronema omphalodes (strain CBS 100304) TaxID=1076935 RepID=U4KYG1_PYROM|nr:Protein of unknown function [Pyronema omphalodes CBS 100304]